jgi:hypothetical protein
MLFLQRCIPCLAFTRRRFFLIVMACAVVCVFSGCLALLELGEVGELGAAGLEVEELGTLRVVSPELVAEEISSVRLSGEGDLGIIRNGRMSKFAEIIDQNRIELTNGKVVRMPGPLYTVNEEVFVRRAPFNNSSNLLNGERYSPGRLVIVNDEINGWYEILLPDHQFGFVPVAALSVAHSKRYDGKRKIVPHRTGYREGVNYIVNAAFRNQPESRDMIVNMTYEDGSFDELASIRINSLAVEKGYRSTPSFFSKNYYIDELGNQLKLGNLTYIRKLKLYDFADYLLIGSYTCKVRVNQLQENMLTADLGYVLNLVNLKTGTIEQSMANTIHGNGFTDDQARNDVMQAFYQIIQQKKF